MGETDLRQDTSKGIKKQGWETTTKERKKRTERDQTGRETGKKARNVKDGTGTREREILRTGRKYRK